MPTPSASLVLRWKAECGAHQQSRLLKRWHLRSACTSPAEGEIGELNPPESTRRYQQRLFGSSWPDAVDAGWRNAGKGVGCRPAARPQRPATLRGREEIVDQTRRGPPAAAARRVSARRPWSCL